MALAGCAMFFHAAHAQPVNIALGKSVTFSDAPNYWMSNDADDIRQLTDGQYSRQSKLREGENDGAMWFEKSTVGWSKVSPLVITIDLGSLQPIAGISYSTAAGLSDVTWPRAAFIAVRDDNKTWRSAGDLMQLSRKNGLPPNKGYASFRFATHDLQTKGRYIALGLVQVPYAFVDEIEVYKGDDAWLQKPVAGRSFTDLKEWVKASLVPSLAHHRVQADAEHVRAELDKSRLRREQRSTLAARLERNVAASQKIDTLPPDFKTILPLGEPHRDIFAVHGEVLASEGFAPLTIWKQHRYQWLPLLAKPIKQKAPQLSISMLKNQFRSDALLLTNATGRPQTVTLRFKGAPRGAQNGWLQLLAAQWTDTTQNVPIADALLPLEERDGMHHVTLPAGMTRKIWLTVDSSKVPAGNTGSTLEVQSGGRKTKIPLTLNVSSVAMKPPRLQVWAWDYLTGGSGMNSITPNNRAAMQSLMRSHYVDTTWAARSVLPMPVAADFDEANQLKSSPDFKALDEWLTSWPDARHYYVYMAVGYEFAGAKMGTPEFNARVQSWAKTLASQMEARGKQARQLGLMLVDEPTREDRDILVSGWGKPIKAAAPELTLFEQHLWERPSQKQPPDTFPLLDVLSFHIPVYYRGGEPMREFVQQMRRIGKRVCLHQTSAPVRLYDPQLSYRHLAWRNFSIGGSGEGFWALADTGGAPTSWTEYSLSRDSYAPVFIDENTVYTSLHWEAAREGVQDFEELSMLQDAINSSRDAVWKSEAQRTLDNAVNAVTENWDEARDWRSAHNPNLTDHQLQKVRALLR
jgi:hypothetical protein